MASKNVVLKARSAVVLMMLTTRKGGAHLDRKKESRRKAGRSSWGEE
jgi:hypothetical protein